MFVYEISSDQTFGLILIQFGTDIFCQQITPEFVNEQNCSSLFKMRAVKNIQTDLVVQLAWSAGETYCSNVL